jgi:hypothetical protein
LKRRKFQYHNKIKKNGGQPDGCARLCQGNQVNLDFNARPEGRTRNDKEEFEVAIKPTESTQFYKWLR